MIAPIAALLLSIAAAPTGADNAESRGPGPKNEPTATQKGEKKKPTVVTSGQLDVDRAKNIAIFTKDVHVVDSGGEMWADKMVVYFNPDNHEVKKLVSTGEKVIIFTGENRSQSRKAVYTGSDGKIVLTGKPRIKHGMNTYGAEKIIIFKDSDKTIFEPRARLILFSEEEGIDIDNML